VFRFEFDLAPASSPSVSVKNAFVPRLWASRQIAYLADHVRQLGADPQDITSAAPQVREIVDEILRLSTKFGILSEYTAFLAREGTDLSDFAGNNGTCTSELVDKAVRVRSGVSAVTQGWNFRVAKGQQVVNYANEYIGPDQSTVAIAGVQQLNDRCFFNRSNRWVDSLLVEGAEPEEVVTFGSDRFFEILETLVARGRAGLLSLNGEILLELDGAKVLVQNP
jgi:Ca-activated chloride channel family protein